MVTRKWLRGGVIVLTLYTIAALVIGYFGVNAYSGNRGLRAKQDLDEQIAQLNGELAGLRAERATWERRVLLLRSGSIDPDMLDERARALLNYADPRELTLRLSDLTGLRLRSTSSSVGLRLAPHRLSLRCNSRMRW
jgi:cell division protein FtsB